MSFLFSDGWGWHELALCWLVVGKVLIYRYSHALCVGIDPLTGNQELVWSYSTSFQHFHYISKVPNLSEAEMRLENYHFFTVSQN